MVEFQFLDKRVKRTKRDLYHALFALLKEKNYDLITVKEIIDLADYSRGTFYFHYKEKDDLLKEVIYYLFKEARTAQRTSYINERFIHVQKLEDEPIYILEHFKKYGEYYQILLSDHVQIDFHQKLTKMLVDIHIEDFVIKEVHHENEQKDTLNKYHAYGLIGMIIEWIIDDFPLTPQELSNELVKIFQYSLGPIRINKSYTLYTQPH